MPEIQWILLGVEGSKPGTIDAVRKALAADRASDGNAKMAIYVPPAPPAMTPGGVDS